MKTIAAIATPLAIGGVSMIRLSGDQSIVIADRVFRAANGASLQTLKGYTACFGGFHQAGEDTPFDNGIALVFRAPKSYTGEEVVELYCHGGLYTTRQLLRAVLSAGATAAEAGEFSKRAFLNGKMSLTQAEAVIDLIHARSAQASRVAKAQMDGALYQKIQVIKQSLLTTAAHLAVWADYPEEDLEAVEMTTLSAGLQAVKGQVETLLQSYDTGKLLSAGVQTAIVGRPNVGKSTLMNLLSGEEKSIVTDIAGTTRDIVEETVQVGDVLLRLADTAGIRQTEDIVENFGVQRAKQRIETAELILAVFDSSIPLEDSDVELMELIAAQQTPAIALLHKTDLEKQIDESVIEQYFQHIVYTSKDNTESIDQLAEELEKILHFGSISLSEGLLTNERQHACAVEVVRNLQEALDGIAMGMTLDATSISIDTALDALLSLSGEKVTEQVVDQVFHHFCVGK